MLNIIKAEFLKYKRHKILLIVLSAVLFFPIIICLANLLTNDQPGWSEYFYRCKLAFSYMLSSILFSIIASKVIQNENDEKIINTMLSYPINRIKFIVAKLIYILFMIVISYFLLDLFIIITGVFVTKMLPNMNIIIHYIKADIISIVMNLLLVPFSMLITNLTKSSMTAPGITAVLAVGNFFIMRKECIAKFWPWISTDVTTVMKMGLFTTNVISTSVFCLICLIAFINHYYKADIK